jgi:hypothetical protein
MAGEIGGGQVGRDTLRLFGQGFGMGKYVGDEVDEVLDLDRDHDSSLV